MASSSNLTVNVSGCVWSSLFLDHTSSIGDQEGFLFGEIRRQTSEDISDSQITRKTEQISINIYSHFACPEPFSFYDRRGRLDRVKLLSMLKDKYKHTIGWYRFRRNTVLEPTMRETTIHRELLKLFSTEAPHLFLLGLFTSGMAWNQATHYFNHQLLTLADRKFKWLGVNIINLGDTSHSEYRESASVATAARNMGIYSGILADNRGRIVDGNLQGVQVIQGINDSVYSKMQILKDKIGESEQMLQLRIEEVRELQRRVKQRQHREEQHRMEQQAKLTEETTDATTELDVPLLAKAVIHHPERPSQKEPLSPTLVKASSDTSSPSQGATPQLLTPSTANAHSSSSPTQAAPITPTPARDATPQMAVVSPDGSSKDPFAGLFKDMKRSIQKTTSLGGGELKPEDGPRSTRAHSWDRTKETEPRTSPSKGRAWNSMDLGDSSTLMDSSPARSSSRSPQEWNTEDSDDSTQLPGYMSSASPTF